MKSILTMYNSDKKRFSRFLVTADLDKNYEFSYDFTKPGFDLRTHEVIDDFKSIYDFYVEELGYKITLESRIYNVVLYLPDYTYTHEVVAKSYKDAIEKVYLKTDKTAQLVSIQAVGDEKFTFEYTRVKKRGRRPKVESTQPSKKSYSVVFIRKEHGLTVERSTANLVGTINEVRVAIERTLKTTGFTDVQMPTELTLA